MAKKKVALNKGFCTEYDDMKLWVENLKLGANTARIQKEGSEYTINNGTIVTIIAKSDYPNLDEYNLAADELIGDGDATAEFVTDDDIYYVVIKSNGPDINADEVTFDESVYFC